MSVTTEYPYPVTDTTAKKLAAGAGKVQTVFDVFAVLIVIATILITVGLFIGAAAEHASYVDPYSDNYTDETAAYVIAGFLAPVYGAWIWGTTKFFAVVSGYVAWRAK